MLVPLSALITTSVIEPANNTASAETETEDNNQQGSISPAKGQGARPTAENAQLAVFVVKDGKAFQHRVKTGDILNSSIIVTAGLQAGEEVASPALTAGAVSNRLAVEMTLASPAGDPVRIDASQRFSLTATATSLRLSDISVTVNQKQASIDPFTVDLSGIDESLVDRVQGGSLVLDEVNPFGVTGNMALRFMSSGMTPIQKTVPLAAGTSRQVVDFTPQELRSMLGREVTATASGLVSAGQTVKLTPAQAVQITTRLSLVIGPKES